eukprot:6468396-Ditylum_brightwellii.AAC.1
MPRSSSGLDFAAAVGVACAPVFGMPVVVVAPSWHRSWFKSCCWFWSSARFGSCMASAVVGIAVVARG